jgi:hypothetical protein
MAESFFAGKKSYGEGWSVKSEVAFSKEDAALVKSAEVVQSEYGLSVCFHMHKGNCFFTPVSNTVTTAVGEVVDLAKAKIITLQREGSADIERIAW